jgi:hypothetical protein
MDRQKRNGVASDDGKMIIRLTNLLELSSLQKLSDTSSFPSSSSSSARYAFTDSSSGRNSCGRNPLSILNMNNANISDYGGSRNQHKKGKDKSVSTSDCNDDRDYLPTSSAISFKSWQSKVGTSSTVASTVNKANNKSEQQDSNRWSSFLDRVNEKEKEKRRYGGR